MSLLISIVALVLVILCWRICQEISHHVIRLEVRLNELASTKSSSSSCWVATVKGHKPPTILVEATSEAEATRQLLRMNIDPRSIMKLEVQK